MRGPGLQAEDLVDLVRQPVRFREYRGRFPYRMEGSGDPEFRRITDQLEGTDLLAEQKPMVQKLEPRAWAMLHPSLGLCLKRSFARILRALGAVPTALLFSKARTVHATMAGGGMAARMGAGGGSEVVLG